MKTIPLALAVALGAAGLALAVQEDDRAPVNKTCPVMKGKPIKEEFMSVYEHRPIAFCCGKCKKLWDADPSEYAKNLPPAEPPKPVGTAQVGKIAPDIEVKDTDGSFVRFSEFKDQIVILQWIDPSCPASERLAATGVTAAALKKIKAVTEKSFHFSVCSAAGAKPDAVAAFLSERKVESRGLVDADGKAAKAFGVRHSSHVIVIDGNGAVRYSGAIDNDPDGKKGDKAVNYLVNAVVAIMTGKKVSPDTTKPYGTVTKQAK